MNLIQLVYVSAAAAPFSPADLRALLALARQRNALIDVSGLLLYHQGSFLQILEGDEEVLRALYQKISKDVRHVSILIATTAVEKRTFGEWSMGFVDAAGWSAGVPGFLPLWNATSSFLELQHDHELIGRLVDGFQEGRLRHQIS